jgi:hypothetical protein
MVTETIVRSSIGRSYEWDFESLHELSQRCLGGID